MGCVHLLALSDGLHNFISWMFASNVPGGGQTPRLQTLNEMLSQRFREEVQGSIVWNDCNGIFVSLHVVLPEESLCMFPI